MSMVHAKQEQLILYFEQQALNNSWCLLDFTKKHHRKVSAPVKLGPAPFTTVGALDASWCSWCFLGTPQFPFRHFHAGFDSDKTCCEKSFIVLCKNETGKCQVFGMSLQTSLFEWPIFQQLTFGVQQRREECNTDACL